MPLVGLIEEGTVKRILHSVEHARADVLLLLERGEQSGHVLFEKGAPVMVRLEPQLTDDPVAELEGWVEGHYSLLKRSQKEAEARGHVLLNGLNLTVRRPLDRWLKRNGWATSIVGYPQHARQVISYIQPEVVLMHCPRLNLGLSCIELAATLRAPTGALHSTLQSGSPIPRVDMPVAPLIVVVEDSAESRCPRDDAGCIRISGTSASLEQVLRSAWPNTTLGLRQARQERTARIYRPEPLPPGTGGFRALGGPEPREVGEEITARDLTPMLFTLLLGSGLIWTVWWLLNV